MADTLTPGITAILDRLANGRDIDGRSWRSLDAAVRRGLVTIVGGRPQLTSAGQGALGLAIPRPEGPDDLEGWMSDHHKRRLEREQAEKLARKAG